MRQKPKPTEYSANIIIKRQNKGWSQEELAGRLGISQAHLSRLESGDRSISYTQATRLARILQCARSAFHPGV